MGMSDSNSNGAVTPASVRVVLALVAGLAAAPLVTPTIAKAESDSFGQREVVDEFTPGIWHKLGGDNSPMFLAMMRVEELTGARFCKVKKGTDWHSDFVDCRPHIRGEIVNRMRIAEEGIMFSDGFSSFNLAYAHTATEHDRSLTKQLRQAYAYIRAGRHRVIAEAESEPVVSAGVEPTTVRRIRTPENRAEYLSGLVQVGGVQRRVRLQLIPE
jgi:hypothetical protein